MAYRNAGELLPPELLRELQSYVSGETVYIPAKERQSRWGEKSGSRRHYDLRNSQIRSKRASGNTVVEIADMFCLSPETVRKIIAKR